jgi:hypothetical protein
MASGNLFEFLYSPSISPIPCKECGSNMHCVRRSPQENGERQVFMCATCGECTERIAGRAGRDEFRQQPETGLLAVLVKEPTDPRNER